MGSEHSSKGLGVCFYKIMLLDWRDTYLVAERTADLPNDPTSEDTASMSDNFSSQIDT